MIRFFVTSRELSGPSYTLTSENAKHAKVLRLKAGEEVLPVTERGRSVCVLWQTRRA